MSSLLFCISTRKDTYYLCDVYTILKKPRSMLLFINYIFVIFIHELISFKLVNRFLDRCAVQDMTIPDHNECPNSDEGDTPSSLIHTRNKQNNLGAGSLHIRTRGRRHIKSPFQRLSSVKPTATKCTLPSPRTISRVTLSCSSRERL